MYASRTVIAASLLFLAGCGHIEHNDVLVFATQTKLALDVSPSAANGGVPSFTLGYKREEGVWMPLVVNGAHSTMLSGGRVCDAAKACYAVPPVALQAFRECAAKSAGTPDACLRALSQDMKYLGNGDGRTDTYSVFASFGADTGASGGGKATLAQFFATGVAAQRLAGNPNVDQALVAKEGSSTLVDAAERDKREALAQRDAALRRVGATTVEPNSLPIRQAIDRAAKCWIDNRAAYRTAANTQLAPSDAELAGAFAQESESDLRVSLALLIDTAEKAKQVNDVTNGICPA